jgi:hypothetical protein
LAVDGAVLPVRVQPDDVPEKAEAAAVVREWLAVGT